MKFHTSSPTDSSLLTVCFILFAAVVNDAFADSQHGITFKVWQPYQQTTPAADTTTTEAQYPGGASAWQMYLMKNLRYPPQAFANRVQGTIILDFVIDEKGKIRDIKASGPTEGGLRQEAIRLLRESGKWIPAKTNDKPVSTSKQQAIIFKMAG